MKLQPFLAGLALAASIALPALAEFPERPIRIVLPYGPGGGADTVGRPLVAELQKRFTTGVVAENKGGAGGYIALESVVQSPPDGYTLFLALTAQAAINPSFYPDQKKDVLTDLAPLTLIGSAPYFLCLNPQLPAKTFPEFVKLIRDNPGKYSYASSGNGSGLHLAMELLKTMTGLDIVHVPYKSSSAAYTDVIGGQAHALFCGLGSSRGYVESGRLRMVAAGSAQRSPVMPQVPTIAESGVPGFEAGTWYALFAPKGTPAPVLKRLYDETIAALKAPAVAERYNADAIRVIGSTPEELTAHVKSERAKWAEVVKRSGARID
jgi:tripartite-type tricarboxylate transporter receptor subunit TctC